MAGLTGKRVKIFFDDMGKVLVKQGTILSEDSLFIQIQTFIGTEAIPYSKVVRVEVFS
jgi:hypothetical protein